MVAMVTAAIRMHHRVTARRRHNRSCGSPDHGARRTGDNSACACADYRPPDRAGRHGPNHRKRQGSAQKERFHQSFPLPPNATPPSTRERSGGAVMGPDR